MNPKISIIVPIYNVEKDLDKCIESVLKQTFKDFELIYHDNAMMIILSKRLFIEGKHADIIIDET